MTDDSGEFTKGGTRILRHDRKGDIAGGPASPEHADDESISNHVADKIGPIETVYHELVSDVVHVDVHWVKASDSRPFHVLVTSGMSALPMSVPQGDPSVHHAELIALLPETW